MAEIDCNKNVYYRSDLATPDGRPLQVTGYSVYDVQQLLSCTPVSDPEGKSFMSNCAYEGMYIAFTRTKIDETTQEYQVSFVNGTESGMARVRQDFEKYLGKVQDVTSWKPQLSNLIQEKMQGFVWDVRTT